MIFLDDGHMIIEQTLAAKLAPGAKREPVDLRIADFEDTLYRLFVSAEQTNIVSLSISLRFMDEIRQFGGEILLEEEYANMVADEAQEGFDLTVQFDLDNMPDSPENLIKKFSQLKRNLVGAPLDQCFAALNDGSSGGMPGIQIHFRKHESMYLIPRADRITIVFSVNFKDPTDQALATVFLQEMLDAQRQVGGAPPCAFGKDPPMELANMEVDESEGHVGYISFVIFKSHIVGNRHAKVVSRIVGFRSYLDYHIKCSKSYLHTRMRSRVVSLLQVLKRSYPVDEKKEKKTASGKTFSRTALRK
jgi:actin related protein 2/3 complex subunit 2